MVAGVWAYVWAIRPAGAIRGGPGHELLVAGGFQVFHRINPDTGRDEIAGDVLVLRIYGPGQSRDRL